MHETLIITLVGPDRKGLVDMLARCIRAHEGSWVESRLVRLAGQFAGVVQVQLSTINADGLCAALENLQGHDLRITVQRASDAMDDTTGRVMVCELLAADRPGLVSELARALAAMQVNVLELGTEVTSAPMSGEQMFRAVARLSLEPAMDALKLQEALQELALTLDADISLEDEEV